MNLGGGDNIPFKTDGAVLLGRDLVSSVCRGKGCKRIFKDQEGRLYQRLVLLANETVSFPTLLSPLQEGDCFRSSNWPTGCAVWSVSCTAEPVFCFLCSLFMSCSLKKKTKNPHKMVELVRFGPVLNRHRLHAFSRKEIFFITSAQEWAGWHLFVCFVLFISPYAIPTNRLRSHNCQTFYDSSALCMDFYLGSHYFFLKYIKTSF